MHPLTFVLFSFAPADDAASCRSQQAVVSSVVTGDASDESTL
jgi:hypothetical protein